MPEKIYYTEKLYLEYLNDFLTIDAFAEHHELTVSQAKMLVDAGREVNHLKAGIITIGQQVRDLLAE